MTNSATEPNKTPSRTTATSETPSKSTSSKKSLPQKPQKSAAHQKTTEKPTRNLGPKIAYAIFVLAWVAFSVTVSQYIIIFPMSWFLGSATTEPFWTLVYYILYNAIAVTLVIFVPPKLRALYRRKRNPKSTLRPAKTPKKSANSNASPNASTTPADNELFSTTPEELGVANWPTFVDIGLAPIAYIAYVIFANTITNILSNFTWFNADQEQNVGFSHFLFGSDRIFAMLAIVFVAPIAEELIMRGWLYGKLRNKFKIPLAIFLTSALFAVLHGQLNVGIVVFILSAILCGLREITGTIWSGMLLHILSNGITFYILFVGI